LTGGASWIALGVGIAASGAGAALTATAAQPDPITSKHRATATTSDPEAPWTTVYGEQVVGAHVPWSGVGGSEDQYSGGDYVIASHACEELLGVQVGEWYFPIVTDPAGDATASGKGLILNTGQAFSTNFEATWYVPVHTSAWWRADQGDVNEPDEAHIALRFRPGDQGATDTQMTQKFGAKYSDKARKFVGHTVCHIIFLGNTELGTMGSLPEVKFHVKGKNDILDATGANPGYTSNPVLIFADICREKRGIPASKIVSGVIGQTLAQLAAECDDTTWHASGDIKKFEFHQTFRADVPVLDRLQAVCAHMAGGFSERGDQVVLYVGTPKTPWTRGPITVDDVVGEQVAVVPVEPSRWVNGYLPHFTVNRVNDEDGGKQLYGKMEPTKNEVASATYVTEDNGVELRTDLKLGGCITARQAKFLAWIALKQIRLGNELRGRFKKRCMVLEPGDVVRVTLPDVSLNNTKYQVIGKVFDARSMTVELAMVRYEDDIYTPGTAPTEDAVGVAPKNRSTIMPLITGLSAAVLEDSAQVQGHGRIKVNVAVTWDVVPNRLVRSAGTIQVSWKKQSESWPRKSVHASGDEIQAVLAGLRQGVAYHIRARCKGAPSAGRIDVPRGKWSQIAFTPDSGIPDMDGPPSTGIQGENQVVDGNFERGPNASTWQLTDSGATAAGSASIAASPNAGKYGPYRAFISLTSPSIGQMRRIETTPFIQVSGGEWKLVKAATIYDFDLGLSFEGRVNILYFDSDQAFVSAHAAIVEGSPSFGWSDKRYVARFQVPAEVDISWLKLQLEHRASQAGAQGSYWDGIDLRTLVVMRDDPVATLVQTSDVTNWSDLVTLDDFPGGDEDDIYFDGETTVEIRAVVSANVKRITSSDLTTRTKAVARLRREVVGGATTVLVAKQRIARADPSELASNGSEGDTDQVALEATITPAEGRYRFNLQGRCEGDGTNGQAQFFERWIKITKV
ncbi:MAG TPA: hypothetical protein VFX95_07240, partial [Caulobacteraceae bacterium]|nr:hypothetical protein [Caulobacteraceae bacterium]